MKLKWYLFKTVYGCITHNVMIIIVFSVSRAMVKLLLVLAASMLCAARLCIAKPAKGSNGSEVGK